MLPDYLAKAVPNPMGKRAPWYANTAPSYAGIFLWVAFYSRWRGERCNTAAWRFAWSRWRSPESSAMHLYYRVPAMLGMKTGFPLYVVGSSTFGTAGGYVMPGLLMGLLQIGWFAVGTFFSADYILKRHGDDSEPGTLPFIVCVLWGGAMAFAGAKGIQYVSRIALFLNAIPLLMLLVVFFQTSGGVGNYQVAAAQENSFGAFTTMIAIVIGFFATAGAAGADFGMNARNESDVRWGGLVGITLAVLVAGGLPLLAVAGAHGSGLTQSWDFAEVVQAIGGPIASAMFFLFAIASIPAACFCAFIAGNSFNTMIPSVPRVSSTMAGARRGNSAGGDGRGGQPDRVFHHCGRQLRTHHRGHGGGLPAGRQEVERPARRRESGRLYRLGGGLHRGHSAAGRAAHHALTGNEIVRAAGSGIQLHRRIRGVLRARQGGLQPKEVAMPKAA